MKVLMVNVVCGIRSTGRICTDLAEELEKQGHEVKIAYGREDVPERYKKYAVKISNDINIKCHVAKSRIFDKAGFGSKRDTRKFISWIESYSPDIIHLHNIHGYYLNVEILFRYLKAIKTPVVWTLHDCWAFTGHCSHFVSANCYNWKKECGNCRLKKEYPSAYFVDNSKNNFEKKKRLFSDLSNLTVITPSLWLKDMVSQSFLKKFEIRAISNGVDLNLFRPNIGEFKRKYHLENKKVILGVATAWGVKKGLTEFLQLADILDEDFQVVLVGMTGSQIKKLPKSVIGIPRTNNIEELVHIYSEADVFVNAGKEETMGMTTVEAMACGTPVVVSNLTAVPEVVSEKGGLIVAELTADNIADAIYKIFTLELNPIQNAKKYEKSLQYQQYILLYNQLFSCIKRSSISD